MVGGGLWKRAAEAVSAKTPLPPPSTTVSSSELGFLLDPTVEQLLLALYQQVTASAGHFFVEVPFIMSHRGCASAGPSARHQCLQAWATPRACAVPALTWREWARLAEHPGAGDRLPALPEVVQA